MKWFSTNGKAPCVLAFGAHPDDLEVGAGGFLSRLVKGGADVHMVVASVPSDVPARIAEAQDGARALGATLHMLHTERACRVEDIPMHELVSRFDTVVGDVQPNLVLTHSANDLHWDHGLVNRATVSALRRIPADLLAFMSSYEMNAQTRSIGSFFVDVTETIDNKLAAISSHKSQLPKIDVESTRDLARGLGRICGVRYAEAFEVLRMQI